MMKTQQDAKHKNKNKEGVKIGILLSICKDEGEEMMLRSRFGQEGEKEGSGWKRKLKKKVMAKG